MLQNVRSDEREETNDAAYADLLASFGDLYVNDAFADSHRAHASIVGIAERLPSYFGRSFEREVAKLNQALKPKQPSLCIIGGAKFDTKSALIAKLAKQYTQVFVAGALMNDIYKARGYPMGTSVVSDVPVPEDVLRQENILVPSDVTVRNAMGITRVAHPTDVHIDDMIVDIGPESLASLQVHIKDAKTILWNGPLGYYEGGFDFFTKRCAEYIAQADADTIVGGGDTIAAIHATDTMDRFTHVSTAGGAMLTYLETGTLPGIEAIEKEYGKGITKAARAKPVLLFFHLLHMQHRTKLCDTVAEVWVLCKFRVFLYEVLRFGARSLDEFEVLERIHTEVGET